MKNGPLSYWAPMAKAAGVALNFNCALLIVPVTRSVLIVLNELGGDHRAAQRRSALFARYCARPLARYVPLAQHVAFHKLIAFVMALLAILHTVCHFVNYRHAPLYTVARFAKWGWGGTTFVTGALILVAMFGIFTAAAEAVKRAHFEIFWFAHHFFLLYYFMLLLHGPSFYLWSVGPLTAYAYERYRRVQKGATPFLVVRVEWIPPVLRPRGTRPLVGPDSKIEMFRSAPAPRVARRNMHLDVRVTAQVLAVHFRPVDLSAPKPLFEEPG